MHILMSKGSVGDDVERLRRTLANALGGDAEFFPSLKKANTPILGLDRIHDEAYSGWDGSSDTGEALAHWRQAARLDSTRRVKDGRVQVAKDAAGRPVLQAAAHGGFDNDIDVVTRTLKRITGAELALPVDDLRGL
ncbi:hypothetical protein SAMN05444679_121114 [Variovorax sp. CF079]|uniref:hypothetical protein n=1 Tax=Variovorax sp. CF079 TaxID=1882774 RepID=UPI0008851DBC|nr:hypothetical protein [Variovorax sp. CF079]SDE38117.1 hypothetical protein SAMN05444679_121114 [Variovorax sp. CF079]